MPGTLTLTDNAPGISQAIGLTAQAIEPSAATPTCSLPLGTYPNSMLTITDATAGAVIYYTMNGTMPTTSSAAYTKPIALNSSGTFTVNAIAVPTGYVNNSGVATATYTIHPYLAKPTFSPPAGSYTTPQSVTISDISTKTIYYTTDGSVPTTSSTPYSGPITVSSSETINAIAVLNGFTHSPDVSAPYAIAP